MHNSHDRLQSVINARSEPIYRGLLIRAPACTYYPSKDLEKSLTPVSLPSRSISYSGRPGAFPPSEPDRTLRGTARNAGGTDTRPGAAARSRSPAIEAVQAMTPSGSPSQRTITIPFSWTAWGAQPHGPVYEAERRGDRSGRPGLPATHQRVADVGRRTRAGLARHDRGQAALLRRTRPPRAWQRRSTPAARAERPVAIPGPSRPAPAPYRRQPSRLATAWRDHLVTGSGALPSKDA